MLTVKSSNTALDRKGHENTENSIVPFTKKYKISVNMELFEHVHKTK